MSDSKKILVVDDDLDCLEQVKMILGRDGYQTVLAQGQNEGEEVLMKDKPDLAILDLMMEERDSGFVLCHEIKRLYPGTPVILLTAVQSATGIDFKSTSPKSRSWIEAEAIMDKPVRAEHLLSEVRRLLAQ